MDMKTKDAQTSAPDAFAASLQARFDYAMAICTTDPGSPAWHEGLAAARCGAYSLGLETGGAEGAGANCSPLLADVRMLREAFEEGVADALREAQEYAEACAAVEARRARQAAVEAAIGAEDWAALSLPNPEAFVGELLAGRPAKADQNTFFYDKEDGLVCTNPYGEDAYFGFEAPTLESAHALLSALARGAVYGAVPPGSD